MYGLRVARSLGGAGMAATCSLLWAELAILGPSRLVAEVSASGKPACALFAVRWLEEATLSTWRRASVHRLASTDGGAGNR